MEVLKAGYKEHCKGKMIRSKMTNGVGKIRASTKKKMMKQKKEKTKLSIEISSTVCDNGNATTMNDNHSDVIKEVYAVQQNYHPASTMNVMLHNVIQQHIRIKSNLKIIIFKI